MKKILTVFSGILTLFSLFFLTLLIIAVTDIDYLLSFNYFSKLIFIDIQAAFLSCFNSAASFVLSLIVIRIHQKSYQKISKLRCLLMLINLLLFIVPILILFFE